MIGKVPGESYAPSPLTDVFWLCSMPMGHSWACHPLFWVSMSCMWGLICIPDARWVIAHCPVDISSSLPPGLLIVLQTLPRYMSHPPTCYYLPHLSSYFLDASRLSTPHSNPPPLCYFAFLTLRTVGLLPDSSIYLTPMYIHNLSQVINTIDRFFHL